MKIKNSLTMNINVILIIGCFAAFSPTLKAQEITTYQYRQVAPDKTAEFIKRETTYWSKVARKAVDKGTLTFWGLFEKVGGTDLQNSPNFLFINTYKDIDGNMGDVWNASAVFPNIPMTKMEDFSFSKTTSDLFLLDKGWQQATKAMADKDFKYVAIYYHNSSNADSFVMMENKYWAPFIKSAMDKNQTAQKAWGNAVILAPTGNDVKFNSISFDLFPSLKDALLQKFDSTTVFPMAGFNELDKLRRNPPIREIYQVVKVVNKDTPRDK